MLAPNVCKNNGNYFKRMIGEREKAITKGKKRIRKCSNCQATTHDSRTCKKPKKGDNAGAILQNEGVENEGAENEIAKNKEAENQTSAGY